MEGEAEGITDPSGPPDDLFKRLADLGAAQGIRQGIRGRCETAMAPERNLAQKSSLQSRGGGRDTRTEGRLIIQHHRLLSLTGIMIPPGVVRIKSLYSYHLWRKSSPIDTVIDAIGLTSARAEKILEY